MTFNLHKILEEERLKLKAKVAQFEKLDEAINTLDDNSKRILREEFFRQAVVELRYSEPDVGIFASPELAAVFEALIELVQK